MGSSFFGRPKMGGGSSSSSSSSPARRGKNKNTSDKPKQPQRGLGVAQLEKMRLHGEFNPYPSYHHQDDGRMQGEYPFIPSSSPSSLPFGFHSNMMMSASNECEGTTIRYADSHPHIAPSCYPSYGILESQQHFVEPNITRHFLHEDPRNISYGSGIQNFETSDSNEPDLELRLSLRYDV